MKQFIYLTTTEIHLTCITIYQRSCWHIPNNFVVWLLGNTRETSLSNLVTTYQLTCCHRGLNLDHIGVGVRVPLGKLDSSHWTANVLEHSSSPSLWLNKYLLIFLLSHKTALFSTHSWCWVRYIRISIIFLQSDFPYLFWKGMMQYVCSQPNGIKFGSNSINYQ